MHTEFIAEALKADNRLPVAVIISAWVELRQTGTIPTTEEVVNKARAKMNISPQSA